MGCEFCGTEEGNEWVLLPVKNTDRSLDAIVCLGCAEKSPAYCQKHKRPHLQFAHDDTTACMLCIEEMVNENRVKELAILEMLAEALSTEPIDEFRHLLDWAKISSRITGNTDATCVLRAIVTKALRLKITIEEVIEQIIQAGSAEPILPKNLF